MAMLDGWCPPGGHGASDAWALENGHALEAYAERIEKDGTAAAQLQAFLAAPGPETVA